MIGLLVVVLAAGAAYMAINRSKRPLQEDIATRHTSTRLKKLWTYVNTNFQSGRYRATERALLAILRIDHKNTAAYNRLGMLYARQENYDDAIECFEIASSLTPTLATLYNLGLVHYEKGNYRPAAAAFEKVVDLDPNVKRYIAFAKALDKQGEYKRVAEILEKVVKLEPISRHQEMLAQAYTRIKNYEKAEEVRKKVAIKRSRQIVKRNQSSRH